MPIALSHLGHWLPRESGVIHPGQRSSGMVAFVRAHRAQPGTFKTQGEVRRCGNVGWSETSRP